MLRLDKASWVRELGAPAAPGRHDIAGAAVAVSAEDIDRAKAELRKGLNEVVFNLILISPSDGDAHYILGSLA